MVSIFAPILLESEEAAAEEYGIPGQGLAPTIGGVVAQPAQYWDTGVGAPELVTPEVYSSPPVETVPTAPSVIDIFNEYNVLPDKLGPEAYPDLIAQPEADGPSGAGLLSKITSVFDPEFSNYINDLPNDIRSTFLGNFTTLGEVKVPELNANAGNGSWVLGMLGDVAGKGLGIVNEGFKLLEVPGRAFEQSIGFTTSFLTEGFGSDLSLEERWNAGKLTYEEIGNAFFGGDPVRHNALILAGMDGKGFDKYVEDNEGGLFDSVARMVADPLWLLGGVPLVPGAMKMTAGAKFIEGSRLAEGIVHTAEFLEHGYSLTDIPILGKGLQALVDADGALGTIGRAIAKPLTLVGMPIEQRIAERVARQVSLDGSIAADITRGTEISKALGNIGSSGLLRSALDVQPERAADRLANDTLSLFQALTRTAQTQEELKATVQAWKAAENLPNVVKAGKIGDVFGVIQKMDFDNFVSLTKAGMTPEQARSKFLQEVISGPGKLGGRAGKGTEPNGISQIAKAVVGAPDSSAVSRVLSPVRWALGATLLNTPAYVVLNTINNMFTVAFDAIDTFNADPYGTIRVFTERQRGLMAERFGSDWEAVRDLAASGNNWMSKELGLDKSANRIWDNGIINFGVRTADKVDNYARRTAAELSMLRVDHYLNRFGAGGAFPEMPDDIKQIIRHEAMQPTEFLDRMGQFENGEGFGFLALRDKRAQYFDQLAKDRGIDLSVPGARAALEETLNIHMGGQLGALDRRIEEAVATGDREAVVRAVQESRAEMQMAKQQADRLSGLGQSSTGVEYKTMHDAVPMDWAQQVDEFTRWNTQFGLMLQASGTMARVGSSGTLPAAVGVGKFQADTRKAFTAYNTERSDYMKDFVQHIANKDVGGAAATLQLMSAHNVSFRHEMKAIFDNVVNDMAKVDIGQAKIFNDATKRYIDSLTSVEQSFRSELRKVYWPPRQLEEQRATDAIKAALDNRANSVRGLFSENVNDYRVGEWVRPPVYGEAPMASDKFGVFDREWKGYTDYLESNVDDIFRNADNFRRDVDIDKLKEFATQTAASKVDYEFARNYFVRQMTDFSMLDYTHQLGIEKYIQLAFPYEYWPTRTAWHWAERMLAKPGAVMSLWHVKEMSDDWQEHVNDQYVNKMREQIQPMLDDPNTSPEVRAELEKQLANGQGLAARMNKLTIPVPFLNKLTKAVGLGEGFNPEIAFDPLAAMFPLVNFDRDYDQFTQPDNIFGKAYRFFEDAKLAPNPMIKSAFQLSGILPERDDAFDWLRNAGSPAATALGFGGVGQAVYRWASLGDNGPVAKLEDALGEDIRGFFLEHGYGGPGVLRALASEITGTDPKDEKSWELYSTSRTLASMAATDPRLSALEAERQTRIAAGEKAVDVNKDINQKRDNVAIEYSKAYFDKSGPLWDNAMKQAASELGLKDVTRWLFGMGGINVWRPGEVIQNGLELIRNGLMNAGKQDDIKQFYDLYPEFTARRIQDTVLRDKDAAEKISREALYFHESNLIVQEFKGRLDTIESELDDPVNGVRTKMRALEDAGLQVKANRDARAALAKVRDELYKQRDAIYDERDARFDAITALYGKPENSTFKDPMERAIDNYKDEWYATFRIKDKEARDKAQEDFLNRFPAANGLNLDWMVFAIKAEGVRNLAFEQTVGKNNEDRNQILDKRDAAIEQLTQESTAYITRRDIETAIGRVEQGPPSPGLAEYIQAINLMTTYKSFETMGLSKAEENRRQAAFWDANPLLNKYYGNGGSSYVSSSTGNAIRNTVGQYYSSGNSAGTTKQLTSVNRTLTSRSPEAAKLSDIWDDYYQLPESSQERRDFLIQNEEEINRLNTIVGKEPIDTTQARLSTYWDTYYQYPEGSQERKDYLNQNREEINKLRVAVGQEPLAAFPQVNSPESNAVLKSFTKTQAAADIARESQIWNHYYSLPKGESRLAYLAMAAAELNMIRARLGKEPVTPGIYNNNPRLSDSAPLQLSDLVGR